VTPVMQGHVRVVARVALLYGRTGTWPGGH
jgi:hypothetical protein